MEIIWVRVPANDARFYESVWKETDETQLAPSVRNELANNGFRAGVVGAQLPDALAHALRAGDSRERGTVQKTAAQEVDLTAEPVVHGRIQQLRRNQRSELQASQVYESLPLLIRGGRELGGRTYELAQAIYALRVDPQPNQTVCVELTPELHYGPFQLTYTGGDDGAGILHQAMTRQREVFDAMRMSIRLAPGEMLLLMSMPDSGGRIAECFHTVESAAGRQQKLILIRLADVPTSDTFAHIAGE